MSTKGKIKHTRRHRGSTRMQVQGTRTQAWRTHARNIYAQTKGFVDIGFVDVDATGNLQASGQCRCMDMGNSGVAALCHGAFAMEACRTPAILPVV